MAQPLGLRPLLHGQAISWSLIHEVSVTSLHPRLDTLIGLDWNLGLRHSMGSSDQQPYRAHLVSSPTLRNNGGVAHRPSLSQPQKSLSSNRQSDCQLDFPARKPTKRHR